MSSGVRSFERDVRVSGGEGSTARHRRPALRPDALVVVMPVRGAVRCALGRSIHLHAPSTELASCPATSQSGQRGGAACRVGQAGASRRRSPKSSLRLGPRARPRCPARRRRRAAAPRAAPECRTFTRHSCPVPRPAVPRRRQPARRPARRPGWLWRRPGAETPADKSPAFRRGEGLRDDLAGPPDSLIAPRAAVLLLPLAAVVVPRGQV